MPQGHRSDCACSVCTQKTKAKYRRINLDLKREALAKMQESHRKVKNQDALHYWLVSASHVTSYGASIAYNVARIALWAVPTLAGIFALLRFALFLFSL